MRKIHGFSPGDLFLIFCCFRQSFNFINRDDLLQMLFNQKHFELNCLVEELRKSGCFAHLCFILLFVVFPFSYFDRLQIFN